MKNPAPHKNAVVSDTVEIATTINGVPDLTAIRASSRNMARDYRQRAILAEQTADSYSTYSSEHKEWMALSVVFTKIAEAFLAV